MKKVIVLLLPLLIFPVLFFINLLTGFGFDLVFPDFYSYYPFPTEVCVPKCGSYTLGLTGSIVYWILAFILHFIYVKKNKFSFQSAFINTFFLGIIAFLLSFLSGFYIKFFIPKTVTPYVFPSF